MLALETSMESKLILNLKKKKKLPKTRTVQWAAPVSSSFVQKKGGGTFEEISEKKNEREENKKEE